MAKLNLYFIILCGFLYLSVSAHAVEPAESDWAYTVQPRDTFYSIYRQYLNKQSHVAQLSEYNHHKLTKKLRPGQVLNIPVAMLKKTPAAVQVLVASGDVVAKMATNTNEQKAIKGDLLSQGDSIKTGKYSVAKLGFADGSVVDVQQNSHIEIYSSFQYAGKATYVTLLKLVKGRTEISANPSHTLGNAMQIQTPSAIAAVRGTQFRVSAESAKQGVTLQETLSGQVALSASGTEVLLNQGYGSLAENNKAPLPPITLPNAPDVSSLPQQLELVNGQITLDLKPQPDAVARLALLATDMEFSQLVSEQATNTNQLVLDIPAEGQYYLRLRAQELHGLQGRDAVHALNVIAAIVPTVSPPKLDLTAPADAAVIALAPTAFSWSAPKADQYLLQISRDEAFKDVVFEQRTTENQMAIKQSFGQGQYYWRVIAVVKGKSQEVSAIRKFSR